MSERSIHGVLVKPLAEQHDTDGILIDPAGVRFDPTKEFPLLVEFDTGREPVGRGYVRRNEDGSLEFVGTVGDLPLADVRLAIGVRADKGYRHRPDRPDIVTESDLMGVSLTWTHQDPDQPAAVIDG